MARLNNPSSGDSDEEVTTRSKRTRQRGGSLTPSPSTTNSSRNGGSTGSSRRETSDSAAMPPPKSLPTPDADPPSPRANKRRRVEGDAPPNATQKAHEKELRRSGNSDFYDPDQDPEERRAVRKGIRDLSRELNDSRAEYLAPGSDGLIKTLQKANNLFVHVKQTSDATLDSRLLVSAADLSAKRTTQLNLGDTSHGIEVDDFVSKCIAFMHRAPSTDGSSGTRRRNRGRGSDDDGSAAENSGDEGDALNWDYLGREACFPNCLRPPVPGFLLGPLSVQKRARKQTQRRERLQKRDPRDAVRPEEVKTQDLEKVENANLTSLCRNIRELLVMRMNGAGKRFSAQQSDSMTAEEKLDLGASLGIADDMGIPLFQFVINPRSFGQTVENLFYVSFLIKEGTVGIGKDSNGLPTLHATTPASPKKIKAQGLQKHQAVFHLDFDTWEDLIDAFDITESIIPPRSHDGGAQVNATGGGATCLAFFVLVNLLLKILQSL